MNMTRALSIRAMAVIAPAMILAATAAHSHEPPSGLLGHYRFDGSLTDASGNGFTAEMAGADTSAPAAPRFVEGRFGRALALDGERAVRVPLDLHYEQYPEVTITGWVFVDGADSRGALVGTGPGDGPQIRVDGELIFAAHPGGRNQVNRALSTGRWQFFAGSWDYRNGTNRLNWRARSQTQPFDTQALQPPGQDLWLGAVAELQEAAEGVAIDDVRIYDRILTDDELAGLRLGPPEERISDATATEISRGGTAVERVADAVDTVGFTAGSGTSNNSQSGPVVESAVLGRLSLDEATALHRELETLIANSRSPDSRVTPEDIRGGLNREVAAELSRDTTGAGEVIEGRASSDGTTTRSEGERAAESSSESAVREDEEQQERSAASGWRLSADDVHRTSVSGATGQIKVPGEIEGGIFSINIGERNNVPCRISLNDYHGVNECGYALSADQELSVSIGSATIGGIAVCSNDRSNQRVKGVEIRGNVIREDGSMGAYRQDADEHTNCRRWEPVVLCPIDYAATGVVGHLNPRQRGSNELVGIQLICRRIVPE